MNASRINTAEDRAELRKLMMVMMVVMTVTGSVKTYPNLSPRGGVADGETANSPGCSGMRVSAGEPGPCRPGGVDEALRVSVDEPFRDTQEVSITRTPIL